MLFYIAKDNTLHEEVKFFVDTPILCTDGVWRSEVGYTTEIPYEIIDYINDECGETLYDILQSGQCLAVEVQYDNIDYEKEDKDGHHDCEESEFSVCFDKTFEKLKEFSDAFLQNPSKYNDSLSKRLKAIAMLTHDVTCINKLAEAYDLTHQRDTYTISDFPENFKGVTDSKLNPSVLANSCESVLPTTPVQDTKQDDTKPQDYVIPTQKKYWE